MTKTIRIVSLYALLAAFSVNADAQGGPSSTDGTIPKAPDPIEKLSPTFFRLGAIRVDTAKREATIPGKMNDTQQLEFIANTKNGFRAYESAFELETNGLTFNLAMILLGLDKANSVLPKFHFDPNPPKGDPVEVWVEWMAGGGRKRIRAEEMLWDYQKKEKFGRNPWVYTGSIILDDGRYRADLDAVLIGFVHDPASIIEWTGTNGVGRFGYVQIDPKLGLLPGTPITVIVKATGKPAKN